MLSTAVNERKLFTVLETASERCDEKTLDSYRLLVGYENANMRIAGACVEGGDEHSSEWTEIIHGVEYIVSVWWRENMG